MKPIFFLLLIALTCFGCVSAESDRNANGLKSKLDNRHSLETEQLGIVITDRKDLPKHVGKIVTIRGVQSRSMIQYVLGIMVEGDYALSDKVVEVTGLLSSYETTQEDVDAFNAEQEKILTTAPRPSIGVHYSVRHPKTGELLQTKLARNQLP